MPTEYEVGALVWWWPVNGYPLRGVVKANSFEILEEGGSNFRKISPLILIALEKSPWFVLADHLDVLARSPEESE